jgi:hypothetical protein
MAKHHVKNKKKKGSKEHKHSRPPIEENLDRFAGSSEDENNNDTDDESFDNDATREVIVEEEEDSTSDEDEYGESHRNKQIAKPKASHKQHDSDEVDTENDEESEDDIPSQQAESGLAGAMAKILGIAAPSKTKSKQVILSKTITPLQRQQKKEKEQEDALRLKRKQRRDVHLTSMHIPLSAATSRPIPGKDDMSDLIAKAMSKEVELESTHRRVATRGVVALFNTISKHQQQKLQEQHESGILQKSNNEDIKAMTKHGFLDMLKKTGSSHSELKGSNDTLKQSKAEISGSKTSKGWNALKDDFMMNSKLKDWDKAMSDDDDSDDDDEGNFRGTKRTADDDDDDVMDNDWSSEDESRQVSKSKRKKVK